MLISLLGDSNSSLLKKLLSIHFHPVVSLLKSHRLNEKRNNIRPTLKESALQGACMLRVSLNATNNSIVTSDELFCMSQKGLTSDESDFVSATGNFSGYQ